MAELQTQAGQRDHTDNDASGGASHRNHDRVFGTDLINPDFAAMARAMGGFGDTVSNTGEFADVFAKALDYSGPSLVEIRIDPEALTPDTSLTKMGSA